MGKRPVMFFDGKRDCAHCAHGTDYRNHVYTRYPCTVKCVRHNCRVYAFSGRCGDHERIRLR